MFEQHPLLFDTKGKRVSDKMIGPGSELKVAFEPRLFYSESLGAGVSLQLKAVQISKLQEFGEVPAEAFGFREIDGYEEPEVEVAPVDQKKPTKQKPATTVKAKEQEGWEEEEEEENLDDEVPF